MDGIQTSGVSELVLEVADLNAAEVFYGGVLGFPVVERWTERAAVWVMAGTHTRIGLWTPQVGIAGGRGGAHVHVALHVEETAFPGVVRRLEGHGLSVHVQDFGDRGHAAYVRDPDGNAVEFWTWEVAEHLQGDGRG